MQEVGQVQLLLELHKLQAEAQAAGNDALFRETADKKRAV
jgi:hypothetical protein